MERKEEEGQGMTGEAGVSAGEHEAVPAGHHFAAPEAEEWRPHPYAEEGVGRRESLKEGLPQPQADTKAQAPGGH